MIRLLSNNVDQYTTIVYLKLYYISNDNDIIE